MGKIKIIKMKKVEKLFNKHLTWFGMLDLYRTFELLT